MSIGLPQREPNPELPDRVTIYEVGPRDGLQNEKSVVPAAVKAEFIRRLAAAGLETIETTSFVPPTWVPQLADAREVLEDLGDLGSGPRRPVLVPNERGLDDALTAGVGAIAIFGSATETFARKNLNRTVDESVDMFAPVVARAKDAGLWVRAYVSMCFGDPWEGPVPIEQVVSVALPKIATAPTPASSALSRPRSLGTSTGRRGPRPSSPRSSSTSRASASCGTHVGGTKEVVSIVSRPAAARRRMNSAFTAAGTTDFSFWRPSRGPTS